MKVVYQFRFYLQNTDFKKIMDIVKPCGKIVDIDEFNEAEKMEQSDQDYIYIEYQDKFYKFNRYDKNFISKVEEAQELNPFQGFHDGIWGHLHIKEIDDRFSHKKYYQINKIKKNQEFIEILNDKIIEDLYNGCLVKK